MSDPVTNGRDALNHWFGYPWYDGKTDGPAPREAVAALASRLGFVVPFSRFPAAMGRLGAMVCCCWPACVSAGSCLPAAAAPVGRGRQGAGRRRRPRRIAATARRRPPPRSARPRPGACRQQGDYGRAIVFLFSHELVQLDKHGRIRLARGKTNRQYLRRDSILGRPSEGWSSRRRSMFEDVFFGHHTLERPAFEACWSQLPEFDKLVGSTV